MGMLLCHLINFCVGDDNVDAVGNGNSYHNDDDKPMMEVVVMMMMTTKDAHH